MLSDAQILTGLQFPFSLLSEPLNTTDAAPFTLTYQFASDQPADLEHSYAGWTAFTPAEKGEMRAALGQFEAVLNIQFEEVFDAPDPDFNLGKVQISGSTIGLGGYSYSIWAGGSLASYDGFAVFDNTLMLESGWRWLLLHEMAHALGLKHPFDSDTSGGITHGPLHPDFDNYKYTVMSYTENPETFEDPGGLALFDVFALQDLWGANLNHNSGDTTYTGPRVTGVDVIWDGGGLDRLDASALSRAVVLNLTSGSFSRFGSHDDVAIAFGVQIEQALGGTGNDRLIGNSGDNWLNGGLGADTLNGGAGNDTIIGGPGAEDLRDVVYAGAGHDSVVAGAGNDEVFGQGGHDTISGGFGADTLQGQDGNDVVTGSAFSDLVFGGAGDDFVNGGFGHDRINGGAGADKFFHVGSEGHGSDWVQDYDAAEGDVLLFGGSGATAADFQVNFTHTENAAGERSGDDAVTEAFVIYKPTGQILWALVDGGGQAEINLQIGSDVFDLL